MKPISADSHVTEPPGTYVDRIDHRFKDRAPRMVRDPERGDMFVIEGLDKPVPMGLIAAAGKSAEELAMFHARFEDMHRGGWDPDARLADQDHCAGHPDRLIGIGQTAMRSVADGIADLERIKALGLRGVMMPGNPAVADYDDPMYGPFYEAAADLDLPLSFHILTSAGDQKRTRGPRLNAFMTIIRGCQDIIGTFIFGGVFERHPRLVCVEADAGWVPHFMYRMDHAYNRHRYWLPSGTLTRKPSEYFHEHVYTTFQDDWVAFKVSDLCNVRRLLWANDFPHSDSTWPNSQALLAVHAAHLSDADRARVLHDNVAELYGLAG